ncbi:MAG: hypothetical protein OEV55_03350, partial [candidate division Zixibacteria bacterium]|nr:hypothetical protein [candidate division Zixibacteria bacterium]
MAKRVLVLTLGLLLILSLSVYGAKKPADNKKSELREYDLRDGSEGFVKASTMEPKVLLPITGDTAGYTWWDAQGGTQRMIAWDPINLTHIVWTNLIEEGGNRYVYYNAWDPVGGWLVAGGMPTTPAVQRGGFGGVDLLPDGREVLYMQRDKPDVGNWGSQIAIESSTPGLGEFDHYDIPDSTASEAAKGLAPILACSKVPEGWIHIVTIARRGGYNRFGYVRCYEAPDKVDTLICASPGWKDPPYIYIKKNTRLQPNRIPHEFGNSASIGTFVATSPVSEKVCITWLQAWGAEGGKNEIYYSESTNNGHDWMSSGYINGIRRTSYEGTEFRAFPCVVAIYDYNNELHLVWRVFLNKMRESEIMHWSPSTGIRKIKNEYGKWIEFFQWWFDNVLKNIPEWSIEVLKALSGLLSINMGVYPNSNYLYSVYTEYRDDDISAAEYGNGDVYVKGSSNGGLTWGPEVNMTNTNTDGCSPPNCMSEINASVGEIVGDNLHIMYIEDKDAGSAILDDGTFTENTVRHLKYPRPSIPAVAQIAYTPAHLNRPFLWATNGGSTSDTITFDNTGTNTLYVTLSGPSWLTINPSTFSIVEAGAAQEVYLTFNGASYSDTILIDSMKVVSNHGTSGMNYIDTALVGIHFVVTDEFYRVEYDTCDYSPITQVSNMGNVGGGGLNLDSLGMFYNGNNYLFEFSPVFVTGDISGTGPVGFTWLHQDHNDFLPEGNISTTKYNDLQVQVFYQKAGLVFPPRRSDHNLYHSWWGYWTRYSKVIQLHPQIILVYDWWVWNA